MSAMRWHGIRLRLAIVLAVGVLTGYASEAAAQVCAGRMVPSGKRSILVNGARSNYRFATKATGTDLGASYWDNPDGSLSFSAGFDRRLMDEGPADLNVVHAAALMEAPGLVPGGLALCLSVSAYRSWLVGDLGDGTEYASYALPAGLSLGLPFHPSDAVDAAVFVEPSLLVVRADGHVLGSSVQESYVAPGLAGGVGIGWKTFVGRFRISATSPPEDSGAGPIPHMRTEIGIGVLF